MGYSGPRQKSLSSWDTVVSKLLSSISNYSSTSEILLQRVYTEGKGRNDLPLEDALVHIDKQLKAIDYAQKKLQTCQQQLQAHRNTSITLVPINRLPWEILSRIVVLGAEEDKVLRQRQLDYFEAEQIHDWDNSSHPGGVEWTGELQEEVSEGGSQFGTYPYEVYAPFATLFAQVCRKWRNVALSTATLWTSVDFGKNSEYVKELLVRSKGCPLTIMMNLEGMPSGGLDEQCSELFSRIDPHVSRVETLQLTASHYLYLIDMLDRWARSWSRANPSLRQLTLCATKISGLVELFTNAEIARHVSYKEFLKNVRVLDLDGLTFPWDNFMFQNLTSLKLVGSGPGRAIPNANQICSVFSGSPKLESLTLIAFTVSDIPVFEYPPVDLKQLHTFTISQTTFFGVADGTNRFLLSIINAPNLERLTLESLPGIDTGVESFVERLGQNHDNGMVSKIKYLRLSNCLLFHPTLVDMFMLMPQIEDLGIRKIIGFGTNLLDELAFTSSAAWGGLLPHLKILRMVQCDGVASWSSLKEMIASRRRDGLEWEPIIDKLVVKWCGFEIDDEMEDWLRKNVRKVVVENSHEGLQDGADEDDGFEQFDVQAGWE